MTYYIWRKYENKEGIFWKHVDGKFRRIQDTTCAPKPYTLRGARIATSRMMNRGECRENGWVSEDSYQKVVNGERSESSLGF